MEALSSFATTCLVWTAHMYPISITFFVIWVAPFFRYYFWVKLELILFFSVNVNVKVCSHRRNIEVESKLFNLAAEVVRKVEAVYYKKMENLPRIKIR